MKCYSLALLAGVFLFAGCSSSTKKQQNQSEIKRIPVIYSTDLFQPPDDPDDHYDIAMLFSMEEIEIKALIFDLASSVRQPEEVGKSALEQLSKITGRLSPPWKTGLRNPLRSPDDQALDQPEEFQGGVELILSTLEQSEEQVVMFLVGSCRDFVVAFNRNPDLLKEKVKAVYVNAGNGTKGIQDEWNVRLDPYAYIGLMFSGLPIYWCPCFTDVYQLSSPEYVSEGKAFCTFYLIPNQAELLASTRPMVKNYFAYALNQSKEEPLSFLDKELQPLPETEKMMWCAAPFLHAAGREIYRTQDGRWITSTPEKAKTSGIKSPAIEVFHFEPVHIRYIMKEVKGQLIPEFYNDDNAEPSTSVQVFRYTHPDYNEIMLSVLAGILETL
jgi:hypothetical protein